MALASRSLTTSALALLALATAPGCVDTTIPDLSRELGEGRTDGPFCSPEDLNFFPPQELRIHLIDVGQGDAIWVQTPYYTSMFLESQNILIDAGPSGNVPGTSPGGAVVVDYLLRNGVDVGGRIHAVVITHAHEDHYGGLPQVLSTFEVERYVDPGFDANSSGFISARSSAQSEVLRVSGPTLPGGGRSIGVPIVPELVTDLFTPTTLFGEYVYSEVIWGEDEPPSGNVSNPGGTDINNTSVAFAIRYGQRQALLMADLESEVEGRLIAAHDAGEISLTSAVLKVAHHGSSSSSTRPFLARVFPTKSDDHWAVISSGKRSFGGTQLPTEQTLQNLTEVLTANHLLSTENRDDIKTSGTEHGDDHILVRITEDGRVRACYGF